MFCCANDILVDFTIFVKNNFQFKDYSSRVRLSSEVNNYHTKSLPDGFIRSFSAARTDYYNPAELQTTQSKPAWLKAEIILATTLHDL